MGIPLPNLSFRLFKTVTPIWILACIPIFLTASTRSWGANTSSELTLYEEIIVTGKVTSFADNQPLPGVNVSIKGISKGTITDASGNYSLAVDSDAAIVFSCTGYVSV